MGVVGHRLGHVTHRWEGHCGHGQTGHVTHRWVVTVDIVERGTGHVTHRWEGHCGHSGTWHWSCDDLHSQ